MHKISLNELKQLIKKEVKQLMEAQNSVPKNANELQQLFIALCSDSGNKLVLKRSNFTFLWIDIKYALQNNTSWEDIIEGIIRDALMKISLDERSRTEILDKMYDMFVS